MLISESKDFTVNSSNLKEIRTFARDIFAKQNIPQELKDDLVLAITEAAQNIVKHAYKNQTTTDKMKIKILFRDSEIEIGFFDTGLPVVPENIQHRKLDDIKPGGLGTFFIKKIMDEAIFRKDKKGWVNHLVLTKKV
jgi:anti-sigma regulatory factor (Ser/Thr protein kinase)